MSNATMQELTIIVGLPGSGKTTLTKNLSTDENMIIDDFFNTHFAQSVLPLLKLKPVIINDPRLCLKSIFVHLLDILGDYMQNLHIHIIFFENSPEQCIKNIQPYLLLKPNIINTIQGYSKSYNIQDLIEYSQTKINEKINITNQVKKVYKEK